MKPEQKSSTGAVDVDALYLSHADDRSEARQCQVIREDALTLKVEDIGNYTLMWTPTSEPGNAEGFTVEDGVLGADQPSEGLCLAMGFALSEGLIEHLGDIKSVALCPQEPGVVLLQLQRPEALQIQRKDILVTSSCGVCGPREILEDNALNLTPVSRTLRLTPDTFPQLMQGMRKQQPLFDQTGGSHAAAIFDAAGKILAVAEDLGRHNALDKVIGMALLRGANLAQCGVVLSSRLSLEMVLKAIRAGMQVMLAVSAPTSLAIEVAEKFGVTLCGFVREQRATVYTHPERVLEN